MAAKLDDWLLELLGMKEKKLPESPTFHPGDLVITLARGNLGIVTRYYWNPRHFVWEYLVFLDGNDKICGKRVLELVQRKEKNGTIEV